jgi:hypothetical protein
VEEAELCGELIRLVYGRIRIVWRFEDAYSRRSGNTRDEADTG